MNKIAESGKSKRSLGRLNVTKKLIHIQTENGSYDFARESLGEGVTLPVENKTLPCSFRTSEDGGTLYGVAPASGMFICQFNRFAAKKGEVPRPWLQPGGPRDYNGKHWVAKDQYMFTCLLTILSGDWKGCEIAFILPYAFVAEANGDVAIKTGAKTLEKIDNALTLFGIDWTTDNLKWSDNILPALEEILQTRSGIFQAALEKGNVQELNPLPDELLEAFRSKQDKES